MKTKNPGLRRDWSVPSLAVILVVVLTMPLIAGCASRTPEQTVAGAMTAMTEGDFNKAMTYYTQRHQDEDSWNEAFASNPMAESGMLEGITFEAEGFESEISGDTARVWHNAMEMMVYVLKKEGGQWKIDDIEVDFGAMMEGLDMSGMELPEGFEIPGS